MARQGMQLGAVTLAGDTPSVGALLVDLGIGLGVALAMCVAPFSVLGLLLAAQGGVAYLERPRRVGRPQRNGETAAPYILLAAAGIGIGAFIASKRHHALLPGLLITVLLAPLEALALTLIGRLGFVNWVPMGVPHLLVIGLILGVLGSLLGTAWRSSITGDIFDAAGGLLTADTNLVRTAAEIGSRDLRHAFRSPDQRVSSAVEAGLSAELAEQLEAARRGESRLRTPSPVTESARPQAGAQMSENERLGEFLRRSDERERGSST